MKIVPLLRLPVLALLFLTPLLGIAQQKPQNRIVAEISSANLVTLQGSNHPLAQARFDQGRMNGGARLVGISIQFQPSAAQQADLNQLLADQQNPSSPLFRHWLTPSQFGSRFGMSDADLAKAQSWLESQGFVVDDIAPGRNRISFSGTISQVEAAFHTELHQYKVDNEIHMANSTELSIPAALSGVVLGVQHLSNFRPKPHYRRPSAEFTSSVSGGHFLAPGDIATIYDLNPLYTAGITGTGQKIAVVGQSAITATDIEHFQTAAGLPVKDPTIVLVPNSGTSVHSSVDETESDLDIEWSGAIAKGATIIFIYVGNSTSFDVFSSIQYAVDSNAAPIISNSYGTCEPGLLLTDIAAFSATFQQANAQGQTIVSASGDSGAADCDNSTSTNLIASATHGLAVDFPAVAPYVTGIGGTEFSADVSAPGTYWQAQGSNDIISSALSYIPETVWDTPATVNSAGVVTIGFSGGGGGKSIFYSKPDWQKGTGVPADGARDVPDISLDASNVHDAILFCSTPALTGSCANGFRDNTSNGFLTSAGGTSFGAPMFAGILAVISQKLGATGLGNINPALYTLASNAVNYAAEFHDTTTGTNQVACTTGTADCTSGALGYAAGTGYDLASGLGTIDAYNLSLGMAGLSLGSFTSATTTVITSSLHPTANTAVTFNVTVSANDASGPPTGTVQFAVDGTNSGSPVTLTSTTAVPLVGKASLTLTAGFSTKGAHTVAATYSGDATYATSSATLNVNVGTSGGFALAAANVTVSQGQSGTSTITATPSGGYTGTIAYTLVAPASLTVGCYSVAPVAIAGTAAVSTTLTFFTSSVDCSSAANRQRFTTAPTLRSTPTKTSRTGRYLGMAGTALASVFLLGIPGLRRRRGSVLFGLLCVVVLSFAAGCGGGGSSSSSSTTSTPKGTYTLTLNGADSTNNITNSTSLNLTVQ